MKAPLWQYLVPKYGNFGGPGWSGGVMISTYADVDWGIIPKDSLDETFHDHDKHYQDAIEKKDTGIIDDIEMHHRWIKADIELVNNIRLIPTNPKEWDRKPESRILYSWFYRKTSLVIFSIKISLYFI